MWTDDHREAQATPSRGRYSSDASDEEWGTIESMLPPTDTEGRRAAMMRTKTKGIKRSAIVDTECHLLAIEVIAASTQDCARSSGCADTAD